MQTLTPPAPTTTSEAVTTASLLTQLSTVLSTNPSNLSAKHAHAYLTTADVTLSASSLSTLDKILRSGLENADSSVGCYATSASDYSTFSAFFSAVIHEYHCPELSFAAFSKLTHTSDWGAGAATDLAAFGLSDSSMRVRVARNVATFPLPAAMSRAERVQLERSVIKTLLELPLFAGAGVYSLTPAYADGENPYHISDAEYARLVEEHVMFKDMSQDKYLVSAGIGEEWPYGRGCVVSQDRQKIVWFGEEDHLRVMCMKRGSDLGAVLRELRAVLDALEIGGLQFAISEKYGFVASCPTNVGTGMRASVHVKIPKLLKSRGMDGVKEKCKLWGLGVRGVGGEHTDVGDDGTVDISPKGRLFVTEKEVVQRLYQGVGKLVALEEEEQVVEKVEALAV